MYTNLIVIFLIALASWAYLFPEQAIAALAELKRQIRLRVIRQAGENAATDLRRNLHLFASENEIEAELVEEVLAENHDLIIERLGRKYADEVLGEPEPTERYY
jgi:hypothetical protein